MRPLGTGRDVMAVAGGGALGAWVRAGLGLLVTDTWVSLAVAIIVANLSGALVLGILNGVNQVRPLAQPVTLLVGTGFCGALTTYSSLAAVVMSPSPWWGIGEVVVLLAGGVVVAGGGIKLGRKLRGEK